MSLNLTRRSRLRHLIHNHRRQQFPFLLFLLVTPSALRLMYLSIITRSDDEPIHHRHRKTQKRIQMPHGVPRHEPLRILFTLRPLRHAKTHHGEKKRRGIKVERDGVLVTIHEGYFSHFERYESASDETVDDVIQGVIRHVD